VDGNSWGVGKIADPMLPQNALSGALNNMHVWIEFNYQWILYLTVFDMVMKENRDIGYICLVGVNPDTMVRTIGKVEIKKLAEFPGKIAEITQKGDHIGAATPAGTDIKFVWAELETLREAEKAEKKGYDAVITYCFSDLGLFAAREKPKIPVVGLRESSIHVASTLERKFPIVDVGDKNLEGETYDVKLASIRGTKFLVLKITMDIKKMGKELLEESKKATGEDDVEVIILSCGNLISIGKELQEKPGVPVLEPGPVAFKVVELLVELGVISQ